MLLSFKIKYPEQMKITGLLKYQEYKLIQELLFVNLLNMLSVKENLANIILFLSYC